MSQERKKEHAKYVESMKNVFALTIVISSVCFPDDCFNVETFVQMQIYDA